MSSLESHTTPLHKTDRIGPYVPFMLLAFGAMTISFSPVYVKCADVGPAAAGFYRVSIACVILFLWRFRDVVLLNGSDILAASIGGVFFAMDLFFWHFAIERVGPGLATILSNFQVFFMALAGALIGRRIPLAKTLAFSVVAMGGLFLIMGITPGNIGNTDFIGISAGLAAALCYAGFLVALRKIQGRIPNGHPAVGLALVCLFSTIVMGLWALLTEPEFAFQTPFDGLLMTGYALSSQVIGWALITKGLPRVPYVAAGLILLIQPALSFLWDVSFFHRPAGWWNLLGCVITLSAVYMGSLTSATPTPEKP